MKAANGFLLTWHILSHGQKSSFLKADFPQEAYTIRYMHSLLEADLLHYCCGALSLLARPQQDSRVWTDPRRFHRSGHGGV